MSGLQWRIAGWKTTRRLLSEKVGPNEDVVRSGLPLILERSFVESWTKLLNRTWAVAKAQTLVPSTTTSFGFVSTFYCLRA